MNEVQPVPIVKQFSQSARPRMPFGINPMQLVTWLLTVLILIAHHLSMYW